MVGGPCGRLNAGRLVKTPEGSGAGGDGGDFSVRDAPACSSENTAIVCGLPRSRSVKSDEVRLETWLPCLS